MLNPHLFEGRRSRSSQLDLCCSSSNWGRSFDVGRLFIIGVVSSVRGWSSLLVGPISQTVVISDRSVLRIVLATTRRNCIGCMFLVLLLTNSMIYGPILLAPRSPLLPSGRILQAFVIEDDEERVKDGDYHPEMAYRKLLRIFQT